MTDFGYHTTACLQMLSLENSYGWFHQSYSLISFIRSHIIVNYLMTSTCFDSFIFLFLENYGVRKLEAFFAFLIATMAFSFTWMFGEAKPSGKELLIGDYLVPICQICFRFFSKSCSYNFNSIHFSVRYFGSNTWLKNNKAGCWYCWLCDHATQCLLAFCSCTIKKD